MSFSEVGCSVRCTFSRPPSPPEVIRLNCRPFPSSLAHIKANVFCCTTQQVSIPLLCSDAALHETQLSQLTLAYRFSRVTLPQDAGKHSNTKQLSTKLVAVFKKQNMFCFFLPFTIWFVMTILTQYRYTFNCTNLSIQVNNYTCEW